VKNKLPLLSIALSVSLASCDLFQVPVLDADGDGLNDTVELEHGLDPKNPNDGYYADNDGDGIVNGIEIEYGLDLSDASDANLDNDDDGLLNYEELRLGKTVLDYNATRDGAALDNRWSVSDIGSGVTYDYIVTADGARQQLRDQSDSHNPFFTYSTDLSSYVDTLYTEGGSYLFEGALFGEGGFLAFQIPASDNFTGEPLVLGLLMNPEGTNNENIRIYQRTNSSFSNRGLWANGSEGQLYKIRVEFEGNNSFAGSIYFNNTLVIRLDNIFSASVDTYEHGGEFYFSSGSFGGTNRGYDLSRVQLVIGNKSDNTTNPNKKDTDDDGLTDLQEHRQNLDPNNPSDGYDADTDNDGVSNGLEIANGYDPQNPDDLVGGDADGDGFTNIEEINVGLDPFVPDHPNDDNDNDGLSNVIEVEYALNPNDPSDGATADNDDDGTNNGDEIANGTNPNEHMLRVVDSFTAPLLVLDTNGDGDINASDEKLDVHLTRYSMRKDTMGLWFFNENIEGSYPYRKTLTLPETRSYRGRIANHPDSSVLATVWPDCTITYLVYVGHTTVPEFPLSADSPYYNLHEQSFDHVGICKTTGPSDARFQRGLKVSLEKVAFDNVPSDSKINYWPDTNSFHLYEKPQSIQFAANYFHNGRFNQDVAKTIAAIEQEQNNADVFTARSFLDRISITDILIEETGYGSPGYEGPENRQSFNWGLALENFWDPRRNSHQFWYENVLWSDHPTAGRGGVAYGERIWMEMYKRNHYLFPHEMGHNYGSKHNSYPERYRGVNAMGGSIAPATTSEVHQGIMIGRREVQTRGSDNISPHTDLRIVTETNWNYHPLAQPDHISLYRDESATIDVLENDSDPNNDELTVISVHLNEDYSSPGAKDVQLTVNPDSTITITPPKGFIGLIDAHYILQDGSAVTVNGNTAHLTVRGILHINVEHNGISDVFTFDNDCTVDPEPASEDDSDKGTYDYVLDPINHTNLLLRNLGFRGWLDGVYTGGANGTAVEVGCEINHITVGSINGEDDKASNYAATQYPQFSGDFNNHDTAVNKRQQYHPHVFEINNKDFSVSFLHRPKADTNPAAYYELARRGRIADSNYDDDGWVIGHIGDVLIAQIHEKSKRAKNSILRLDLPGFTQLLDSSRWTHIAMTIDWQNRAMIIYVDGAQAGAIEIPSNFKLVSSSGVGNEYTYGAYAVFGQSDVARYYNEHTHGNNGIDDILIAHKALSAAEILDVYQSKFPAFAPIPVNGQSVDIASINSLNWDSHIALNVASYNVSLASDSSFSTLISSGSVTSESFDISSLSLDPSKPYYWRVDIVLDGGETIEGEVWSFWQKSPSVMLFRSFIQSPKKLYFPEPAVIENLCADHCEPGTPDCEHLHSFY